MNIVVLHTINDHRLIGLYNALEDARHKIIFTNDHKKVLNLVEENSAGMVISPISSSFTKYIDYLDEKINKVGIATEECDTSKYSVSINLFNKKDPNFLDFLADDIVFRYGIIRPQFKTKLVHLSIDPVTTVQQLFLLDHLGHKYDLKIYGPHKINSVFYMGKIVPQEYKDAIASADICLMFNRAMYQNAIMNNTLPLLLDKPVDELERIIESPIPTIDVDNVQTYRDYTRKICLV